MARRNLDEKHDNSNFRINKNLHPFYNEKTEEKNKIEQQEDNNGELSDSEKKLVSNTANNARKNVNELGVDSKANASLEMIANSIMKKILFISIPFLMVLFLLIIVVVIIGDNDDENTGSNIVSGGYFNARCQEVTVKIADKSKNYEIVDTKTVAFEDYVAGVVAAEIGSFNNLEVYKEFAIAARSYFYTHDDECTIESSDRKQVYKETSDQLIDQAIEETKGQVILENNEIKSVQYDAFCTIDVTDKEYTLKQKNQKIPRSWADSQGGIIDKWKDGTCNGNHGNGLSQWGSYYLATEKKYDYEQLLKYYLGDDIAISTSGFMSSIPGLEIKNTTDAEELHQSLESFLSVNDLDSFISENVDKNGRSTRAGVVTAAVSLVNYLYDGYHKKLPYCWDESGNHQTIGVYPQLGASISAIVDIHGRTWTHDGFDCSSFVSWAIYNGGFNINRKNTADLDSSFSSDSCNIASANCIGQPGDLINSASCHAQMIVAVDEASGIYYIAESTGDLGLIIRPWGMHDGNCGNKTTKILHMDNFYGS